MGNEPTPLPIAKSSVRAGVPLLAAAGPEVAYEWFYVEAALGDDHLVAIFSLRDPFRQEGGHCEASLYVTWHRGGEVEDYAYALFEEPAGQAFRERVEAFFSRAAHHSDLLEITLPSHALSHDLTLRLSWTDARGEAPPRATANDTTQFVSEARVRNARGVKHVWQPLALGHALTGRLFRSHVRAPSSFPTATRVGLVHDLPLARKLQSKAKRFVASPADSFASDAFAFEEGAWCYVDHNAGFERLSGVGEPWMWWHARGEGAQAFREIGYWFPRRRDGHLVDPSHASQGHSQDCEARVQFLGRDPLRDPFRAAFGVEAARGITLRNGSPLDFPRVIEAAPFYARLKAVDAQGRHLGTLEALHPARLASVWTPLLMACRQTRVRNLGTGYGSRAFLATCRAVTASNGRSFYLASLVLPHNARVGAYAVYTLCRLIDDATDEAESLRAALGEKAAIQASGSHHAAALLDFLFPSDERMTSDNETSVATFLEAALVATGAWTQTNPLPPVISEQSQERARAFLCEARACARSLGLERAHFEELVAGQAMDEHFTQPANAAEFRLYCFRVAGVVGLLMARVFGARVAPATLEAAESLGLAMQITNILRDVREDFVTRGRIYLPTDACARHGVNVPQALADADAGVTSPGAAALVRHLGLQAVDAYRTALRGVPDIPSLRARLCVRLMAAVYGAILGVILLDPSLPYRRRVIVPQARRLFIALKVLLGANPLAAAGLTRRRVCSEQKHS